LIDDKGPLKNYKEASLKQICQHFQSLGISPKDADRHANLISKGIKANGPEWVVARYKALSAALKSNLINGKYNLPEGWATRQNSKGKTIVSDGFIHRLLMAKTQQDIFISNAVFRVHTLLNLREISPKQKKKFDDAVLGELNVPDMDGYHRTIDEVANAVPAMVRGIKVPQVNVIALRYLPMGNKSSPIYERPDDIKSGSEYIVTNEKRTNILTKSVESFTASIEGHALLARFPDECSYAILGTGDVRLSHASKYPRLSGIPVGTIGYIQEPSCKMRTVASPALVYQALGESLKQRSKFIIESIAQCDTRDHEVGRVKAQMWLWEGRTVFGFDASSFTDRLPLALQLEVMTKLENLGLISAFDKATFELVSNASYRDNKFNRLITWKVGQPQGFGPSFNIATLTHVAIVMSCISHQEQENLFSVIGDDILIADDALAQAYVNKMMLLGVDINLEKSLESDNIAEYAGKIITAEGVIPSAKIKFLESLHDMRPKDVMSLGDKLVAQLLFYGPKKWLNISPEYKDYAIKAILPEWAGGFGFKHPQITSKVNFDALREKSIKDDVEEYFTTYSRDDLGRYLKWLSQFDTLLMDQIPLISPAMWQRYTSGSVNKISSFNGMPMHPKEGVPKVSGVSFKGREQKQYKKSIAELNELLVTDLLVQYLYQIQNPNQSRSVIIIDYKATMKKLTKELTHTQADFVKYGVPQDYVKFFVTAEGYIKKEFLDKLQEHDKLKTLIPTKLLDDEAYGLTATSAKGLNHVKYINKNN
jgi:hypothetical protein